MTVSATFVLVCVFSASSSGHETEARLRYYYNSLDSYEESPLSNAHTIFSSSWYNSSRSTVIFAHGFTGTPTGQAVIEIINTFLERNDSNVALLNWECLAAAVRPGYGSSYANWAVPNAIELGMEFADYLYNSWYAGLDLNKTHLLGHSLGAHVFGIAGNRLSERKVRLPRITGLDPSGLGFENKPTLHRLNSESAVFVSVIHSDPHKYGISFSIGTVDFWPNYTNSRFVTQPGCKSSRAERFSAEDLCNHNRSWQLLIDAVRRPGTVIGLHATNYRQWRKKTRNDNTTLDIGVYDEFARKGNYYLITNEASPFGLRENGLYISK